MLTACIIMTAPVLSLNKVIAQCSATVKTRSRKKAIAYDAGPDVITGSVRITPI
jgi:hypothetical protein